MNGRIFVAYKQGFLLNIILIHKTAFSIVWNIKLCRLLFKNYSVKTYQKILVFKIIRIFLIVRYPRL